MITMKSFDELNATNSTIIEVDGKELRTTQDPYINGDVYMAAAVDSANNEHRITWEITNPDTTDESEACDWDHPIAVMLLGK
jgi:hypothetical protein